MFCRPHDCRDRRSVDACFLRVRRFDTFEERLGITRHVLAERLKKLVTHGVLKKVPYQLNPAVTNTA
jgi:DNA-binding HxlR family transcriptional regulator